MDSFENTINFEEHSQTENTPKPTARKTSKKKGFLIGTVITIAVLIVAVIVMAIILSNRYLEKVRGFYPVESYSFNGYEIVNDDGLFYLTKDGKKVSREGYTMLVSLSAERYSEYIDTFNSAPDAKIYDYFLARKEESQNYFLIDGEGEEFVIEGENWKYQNTLLPFVSFKDQVTDEVGVLSLENLDSDISKLSEKNITLTAFDSCSTKILDRNNILAGAVILEDSDAGTDSPKYIFADATGKEMFTSIYNYEIVNVHTDDSYKDLVLTSNGDLYDLLGNKLNNDVTKIEDLGDCVIAHRNSTDGNSGVFELVVYSHNGSFSIKGNEYDLFSFDSKENLIWLKSKNAGYTLFNLNSGEKIDCKELPNSASLNKYVICNTSAGFNYVDVDTGKTVLVSPYGDMQQYSGYNAVLYSPSESQSSSVALILHFVASGKTATTKPLYYNQSIQSIFNNEAGGCAYIITNDDNGKKTVYAPFASNPETKSYDEITVIDAFSEGAPIAVATSFDSNRFEFIDVTNSKIVYSVTPDSAEKMALTSVEFVSTYALYADYDEGVEIAVFKTVETDTDGDVVRDSCYAFSRLAVMTGGKDPASTADLVMTELGDNVQSITAPTASNREVSKFMIVQTSVASSDVYTINDDYKLEELSTIPYGTVKTAKFGNSLDGVYLKVSNGQSTEFALYTVGGEMILNFHSGISVSPDGKYIMAKRNGVYGAYKYDAEKGRIKQILNFEFASVQYMGDGGFLVQSNYDEPYYLYDERKLARPEPIANIITSEVISWDAEAGAFVISENTYYNIAGKLYVHRGEAEEIVDTAAVGTPKRVYADHVSYSPTLVNFHDCDGKLIESKVVYPTNKSELDFMKNYEGNWYRVSTKSLQDHSTKTSADFIMYEVDGSGGVINLYKQQP